MSGNTQPLPMALPFLVFRCARCANVFVLHDDSCSHPLEDGESLERFCSQVCCGADRADLGEGRVQP